MQETDASDRIFGDVCSHNAAGEGDITNVAVREAYRGNKIATALLTALLKLGRKIWHDGIYAGNAKPEYGGAQAV